MQISYAVSHLCKLSQETIAPSVHRRKMSNIKGRLPCRTSIVQ